MEKQKTFAGRRTTGAGGSAYGRSCLALLLLPAKFGRGAFLPGGAFHETAIKNENKRFEFQANLHYPLQKGTSTFFQKIGNHPELGNPESR